MLPITTRLTLFETDRRDTKMTCIDKHSLFAMLLTISNPMSLYLVLMGPKKDINHTDFGFICVAQVTGISPNSN